MLWGGIKKDLAANVKVAIDVDCHDLAGTLGQIDSLKLNQNISTIRLYFPRKNGEHRHKKVIDGIVNLLKANPNIKNLTADNFECEASPTCCAHLFANGESWR